MIYTKHREAVSVFVLCTDKFISQTEYFIEMI